MKARVSVVVVAHNEEERIGTCLRSLLIQEEPADEIILIAHNCSDRTEEIAGGFPGVRVVSYQGPAGTVYAHERGFLEAQGEYVASLDGDSAADPRWLAALIEPLHSDRGVAAVTNPTIFHGNLFVRIGTWTYFYLGYGLCYPFVRFFIPPLQFWSTSFACRKSDFEAVGGYAALIAAGAQLGLSEWAEDYYLSRKLMRRGRIALTFKTVVHAASKQETIRASLARFLRQQREMRILRALVAERLDTFAKSGTVRADLRT